MQQVDRKIYKKRVVKIIFILIFMVTLTGCSSKNVEQTSIKHFDNTITKDELLHATKRVFDLSDKNAFVLDTYRDEINIIKTKAVHRIFTMKIQNDHFDFSIEENINEKNITASLSLYRTYGVDEENKFYLPLEHSSYTLFWDRINYLVGVEENWRSCSFYNINDFFCDVIDLTDTNAKETNRIVQSQQQNDDETNTILEE